MKDTDWENRYKCVYDIVNELVYHSGWSIEDAIEFINSIEDADVVSKTKYDKLKEIAKVAERGYHEVLNHYLYDTAVDPNTTVDSKWISVKDRLPEESGNYLTYKSNSFMAVLTYSAKYKLFNAWDWLSKETCIRNATKVTHWMPLPEEPGKEDENGKATM